MDPTQDASPPPEESPATGGRPPTITTARLHLDRLRATDVDAFFSYRSRPEVCRNQSFEPADRAEAASFIASLQECDWAVPGTWFQLAIRGRATEVLIGDLGVHILDEDQVELGFTVAPEHQRRGYAAEAVRALLDHLFLAMGRHRAIAAVDPRNRASVSLLEKLGIRREAHFRRSLRFKGEWADDLVFALLSSGWPPTST